MRRVYRGLAKIEDSFKITITFFESRIYLTDGERAEYNVGCN